MVQQMMYHGMELTLRTDYKARRTGIVKFSEQPPEVQEALIRENPLYGNVICRCETVTEAEILQAIHRPLGARSMDAIKRRVRAGTGRCQAGFCGPKVLEILAREWNCAPEEINKHNPGSYMVVGRAR